MNSAHRIAALHTTDFSIKKKERRKRRWLGAQHTGGPSRCPSPRTWGNRTPARSTAGRKLCRRLLGSNSPWQHRPSCQEAISLPALPATGLLIQKAPSTDAPAQQPATPGCNPSPVQILQPQNISSSIRSPYGVHQTHQPKPKHHSSRHSVPPVGTWHRGAPLSSQSPPSQPAAGLGQLQGWHHQVSNSTERKGAGKEEKNNMVLKIRSPSRDPRSMDCGSDSLCVPECVKRASK